MADFKAEVENAGDWLFGELLATGCKRRLARNICKAAGQRMAMVTPLRDAPLTVARQALANYQQGHWESPGPALAKSLIKEYWGDPPSKERAFAWLLLRASRVAKQ